jgi:hypothetical protein
MAGPRHLGALVREQVSWLWSGYKPSDIQVGIQVGTRRRTFPLTLRITSTYQLRDSTYNASNATKAWSFVLAGGSWLGVPARHLCLSHRVEPSRGAGSHPGARLHRALRSIAFIVDRHAIASSGWLR